MTIQLPILLWTVITFCLAMVILNRLLFRPMLAMMDKRQEKIDRANAKKAEIERRAAEAEERLAQLREEQEKHQAEQITAALAKAHEDAQTLITVTTKKQNQRLDMSVLELENESKIIEKGMDDTVEAFAKAYLTVLLS